MLTDPSHKYRPFPPIALADRQWPNRTISQAPIWMSTDLRDGNQALFEPMNAERKLRLFRTLCSIGFKEIEVAFPSASQTDFDFVRRLINEGLIPADVTIEVLSHAREPLLRRTVEALQGARSAIVHIVNATSQAFRDQVLGMRRSEVLAMAVDAVRLVKQLTADQPQTQWRLQYSLEAFTATEPDFAVEVCDAVSAAWGATPDNKIILNLPSSVETATPNVYADQIEWMHRHIARRDSVILSVHPHNDRGTAVAAAELALMAGAERVEGCLFGNGERTGNVDLVTLALNLYTQGVAPGLDFSDIDKVVGEFEACTGMSVPPRQPYAGELVFTAFSGSHQDAIKKGFAVRQPDSVWNVPYLPFDPADVGRGYDAVIRINSQSGKGGIAHLLESHYGVVLPRRLQIEFSRVVQQHTDRHGGEIGAEALWQLFAQTYLDLAKPLRYRGHQLFEHAQGQGIQLNIEWDGEPRTLTGVGNGPIDAAVQALHCLGGAVSVRSYEERSVGSGGDAQACAFVELAAANGTTTYGVGLDANIVTASIKALISGCNRLGGDLGIMQFRKIEHAGLSADSTAASEATV
ncbi:2-isopropylmalate synthase [Methylomonas sp. EbB]|uniref:2-isopropylmalate synthase n=1 Tax=Methylomonas fluvii TaxID=1854564 RepID=A0ABR9DIY2_9GAMM|nr:2-isopropylmalate synthase [Methylomonas fluvii]MBD9363005.1 2-isopropylmalate synthase [Methylomonas fluvii]MBD9363075.1 2-isopropylmalate synthase [Methylomonas fluvii]CAD6876301.1 2-isopropylmalate synthase (EC 2.3.3.13) [Methylomonas fluvii]